MIRFFKSGTQPNGETSLLPTVVSSSSPLPVAEYTAAGVEKPAGTAADPVRTSPLTVGYGSAVSKTRPNDTTAYGAADVIGGADTNTASAFAFTVAGAAGGDVLITSASLEIDVTSIPSGMTSFTLYLYNVTPPSAYADNAAWDIASGDRASFLGSISLGSPVDLGSTLYVETNGVNKQITAASASVYGYLVTTAGWTPAASTVFKVTLHSVAL